MKIGRYGLNKNGEILFNGELILVNEELVNEIIDDNEVRSEKTLLEYIDMFTNYSICNYCDDPVFDSIHENHTECDDEYDAFNDHVNFYKQFSIRQY